MLSTPNQASLTRPRTYSVPGTPVHSVETEGCAALLAENGRLSELENVADKYDEMLRAARGQIFAEVTVAEVILLSL